jgi:hypothetical protein
MTSSADTQPIDRAALLEKFAALVVDACACCGAPDSDCSCDIHLVHGSCSETGPWSELHCRHHRGRV